MVRRQEVEEGDVPASSSGMSWSVSELWANCGHGSKKWPNLLEIGVLVIPLGVLKGDHSNVVALRRSAPSRSENGDLNVGNEGANRRNRLDLQLFR